MLADVWTVIRTEYLDSFHSGDGLERVGVIVLAPVLAVLYSLPWGLGWYSSGHWEEHGVSFPAAIPWLFTLGFVLRERSRLSMEALAARHLPRDAILFGMIGAGVGVGLAFWLVMSAVSLIILNLMQPDGPWASVPALAILVLFALEFLISLSAATGGVLLSFGAAKIGQICKLFILVFAGLALVVFAIVWMSGEFAATWIMAVQRESTHMQLAIPIMVTFAVLDLVLILFARARFKRTHLVTEKS